MLEIVIIGAQFAILFFDFFMVHMHGPVVVINERTKGCVIKQLNSFPKSSPRALIALWPHFFGFIHFVVLSSCCVALRNMMYARRMLAFHVPFSALLLSAAHHRQIFSYAF